MESKKVSFGFSKIAKKSNLLIKKLPDESEKKIELIKCLEGQEIKLIDEKPIIPPAPLVIPLIGSSKTSAALLSLQKRKAILEGTAVSINENEDNKIQAEEIANKSVELETIEKRAARELLEEVSDTSKLDNENSTLALPIKSADELPLKGATESTIDDYENIPIQDFGKAMLRGMGWKEEVSKKSLDDIEDGPVRRPKGMGLGADKSIKRHVPLIPPGKNEVLEIKKKAFVRIIGGKNKDLYGQIEGFDDYSTRIIVRFALGGHTDGIHEFMIQPVSNKEYQQYSKVINSAKYDQYKKLENEHGQIIIKEEDRIKLESNNLKLKKESEIKKEIKDEKLEIRQTDIKNNFSINKLKHHSSTESLNKDDIQKKRSRSRDRNIRERHRHNSSDSNKSNDSSPHRRHHKLKKKSSKSKKSKKNKHHHRSSSSENDKRHKKKTKRSKRSRSRSKGRK